MWGIIQKKDTHTLDFDVTLADQGAHWYIILPYASLFRMPFKGIPVMAVHPQQICRNGDKKGNTVHADHLVGQCTGDSTQAIFSSPPLAVQGFRQLQPNPF